MEDQENKPGLYQRLDETIMKGVNAGVRAWNWTTGRTRADLANTTLIGVPVLQSLHVVNENGSVGLAVLSTVAAGALAVTNKKIDEWEREALSCNAVDYRVERVKDDYEWLAPFMTSSPFLLYALEYLKNEDFGSISNCSHAPMGIAGYIMRADYLPPRKDCVRRGIEKLTEKLKEIEIPNPLPQPVPVGANYEVI